MTGRRVGPVCNHGAKVPTEAERFADHRVRPDWVRITFREQAVVDVMEALWEVFGVGSLDVTDAKGGLLGFQSCVDFAHRGVRLARYAFGGDGQRGRAMLEISGVACERVVAWSELLLFVQDHEPRLTRLDLALDTEAVTLDEALAAFKAGEFNGRGRAPTGSLVDDLGSGKGRTLYVGRRGNDRMLRVYEKGKQLGQSVSRWVRVEVELLAKTTLLPLGAIADAEAFFAGSYEWCRRLIDVGGKSPERRKRASVVVLERAIEIARQQVGGVVSWLSGRAGFSTQQVVRLLWRPPSSRIEGAVDPEFAALAAAGAGPDWSDAFEYGVA